MRLKPLPSHSSANEAMALRVYDMLVTMISGTPLPLMSATSTPMLTPLFSISTTLKKRFWS